MMLQTVREDEEVKAQLIQRIDNLTADNDCLKSEMDLVRKEKKIHQLCVQVLKSQQETRAKEGRSWSALQVSPIIPLRERDRANLWPLLKL